MSVFAEHQLLFTVAASIVTAVLLALLYVSKSRDADDWAIRLFQDLLANRPGTAPLRGNITVVLPASGNKGVAKELRFGDGVGKPVRLAVDDVRFFSACIAEGSLGLAESYMNNWFHFETGSLYDFTAFLLRNRIKNRIRKMLTLSHKIRGFRTWLHYKLIGHRGTLDEHYGVHNDLYRAMLGDYMVYTCPVVPSITFPAEKAKKLGIPTELRERFYTVPSERQQNGHSNGKSNGKSGSDHAETAPVYYHPLDEVHFPLSELGLDLDVMQAEKLRRVCEKLQLRPGQRMLDIGCGFGGLSIFASKYYGVHTTGFAITDEMVRMAKEQAARLGATTCTFHSRDLSMLKELPDHSFDAIAGIGVFEHVQTHEYKYVFQQLKRLLTPNGVCLLHAISHPRLPLDPDPFIQRHVFPNSRQIVLSEMTYMMETNELAVIDVDNIGPSYSFGLRFWLDRSLKHFEERAKAGKPYPERFVRMWDAYLSMGTAYSAHGDSCLYQILFHSNSCGQRALDRSAIHFKPLRQTA